MEKRVFLAMILSFLVVILWSYLFTPQTPNTRKQEVRETKEMEKKEPPREEGVLQAPLVKKIQEGMGKEILVETPRYVATISTLGPTIKSFRLKNYFESLDKGKVVDVAAIDKENEHIQWALREDEKTRLLEFQANKREIRLNQGEDALVFSHSGENGLLIEHVMRFYANSYKIDVITNIKAKEPGSLGLVDLLIKGTLAKDDTGYLSHSGFAVYGDKRFSEITLEAKKPTEELKGKITWLALESAYFASAVISSEGATRAVLNLRKDHQLEAVFPLLAAKGGAEALSKTYTLYLGPKDLDELKKVGHELSKLVNFGWTDIIAKPLLYVLKFSNNYVKNYGISIILLTILVKIVFWPLSNKSYKSMKEMQKLQPLIMKIREKYKDNKEAMNREVMALYRTYKVNPMSGCLPILIQIPVFFALYRVLGSSIELRHAPFFLWIKDLSAPERLFEFSFAIPLMKPPYGIPVLTLLMGASMFIQQKMSPSTGDPTQAKVMLLLPLIFTFMFINFPAGLVLYWLVNNILSIGQQYYVQKKLA